MTEVQGRVQFDFKEQTQLVEEVVGDLLGSYASCWNLVVPPSFNGERLGDQLAAKLRGHARRPRVAARETDASIPNVSAFVRDLHQQWFELKTIPKQLDKRADVALDLLLADVRKSERPVILILKRFHRVLDYLEMWVLGKLRTAEQAKHLRTVTITYLPYDELKKRWEWKSPGHWWTGSEYGDTHGKKIVAPLSLEELIKAAEYWDIPEAVASYIARITGGFPEPMAAVLECWLRDGRPDLRPDVRARLRQEGEKHLDGFVDWLDVTPDRPYRNHTFDLYHRVETERACDAFHSHAWEQIVLDGDDLRAECVGSAAVNAALYDSGDSTSVQSAWINLAKRAHVLYERRQYEAVLKLFAQSDYRYPRPQDQILRAHAQVMKEISGEYGAERFGEDTDCKRLRRALSDARGILQQAKSVLADADKLKIEGRYQDLEELAQSVAVAASVGDRYRGRVVDILAGYSPEVSRNARTAVLLLLIKFEATSAITSHTDACQLALPLPEQIFRVWAMWKLAINYYSAPEGLEKAWLDVERVWPDNFGPLQRAVPNEEFRSFVSFAYFALSRFFQIHSDEQLIAPEPDLSSLGSALSFYNSVRTGKAHGLYLTSASQRKKYFDLIDRWLVSLVAACPDRVTREELLALLAPLPVVDVNGLVIW